MSSLPILMYHNIINDKKKSKGLNIFVDKLEEQLKYLVANNYKTYHLSEIQQVNTLDFKNVILTFDDVTKNQLTYAVPLLEKYNLKATFFIPFKYVGGFDEWNNGTEPIMNLDELKNLPSNIELAYHSFAHPNFVNITVNEIVNDFHEAQKYVEKNNLNVFPAIAYPYGKYPKKNRLQKKAFFSILKENNMVYGLRIGNRVNKFPFKNPYEIMRIDVKGEDSLLKFKLKLKFGKLKLF